MANRRWMVAAIAALAPWAWFAARDLGFVFDLLATGLPLLLVVVALAAAVFVVVRRRHRELIGGAVSCLGAATVAVSGPWRPQPTPAPLRGFRIVSANVSSQNRTLEKAVAD